MSESVEKVEVRSEGRNRKKKAHKRQGEKRPQMSRDEVRAAKLARKLERANQPDTAVVDRKALETNASVALLGKNDYLIDQLRKKVGFDRNINVTTAMNVIQINQRIREVLSVQNALICHALGMEYEAPKGLDVPTVDPKTISTNELLDHLTDIIESVRTIEAAAAEPTEVPATAEEAPSKLAAAA